MNSTYNVLRCSFGTGAFVHLGHVDADEDGQEDQTHDSIGQEDGLSALGLDEHASKDSTTEASESVMETLEYSLSGGSELSVGVVGDEGAAGGPDGRVRDALSDDTKTLGFQSITQPIRTWTNSKGRTIQGQVM